MAETIRNDTEAEPRQDTVSKPLTPPRADFIRRIRRDIPVVRDAQNTVRRTEAGRGA